MTNLDGNETVMNDSIGAPTVDVEDQVRQMGAMPNSSSNSDED